MELRVVPLNRLVDWPQAHAQTSMILVQPHVDLDLGQAGYRLNPALCQVQVQTLRSALELAQRSFGPQVQHSLFTVLPEYALPSDQFETCESLVRDLLPANAVCLSGLDAISPERWLRLLENAEESSPLIAHARDLEYEWVNAAVCWVKDRNGQLHRFLQAKLRPNPQEQRAGIMYRGNQVLYMTAESRSFSLLLCYDFIAVLEDGGDVPTWLWQQLQHLSRAEERLPPPTYLFVLQDNARPDHSDFHHAARQMLTLPGSRFEAVLFVNRAGASGQTCICCSKGDWPPTRPDTHFDDLPRLYRRKQAGDFELTRLEFRTGAPAAHRFLFQPRSGVARHAGALREPITHGWLHLIEQGLVLRNGSSIHALQHVVGEAVAPASPSAARRQPLTQCQDILSELKTAWQTVGCELQRLSPSRLRDVLTSLLCGSNRTNPDFWEERSELRAIRRLIEALYVLQAGGVQPRLCIAQPQFTADCADFTLTVLGGDEETVPEYLYEGFLDRCYGTDGRPHLLLLLDHLGNGPGQHAARIDRLAAKRMGAGGGSISVHLDDGPFGPQRNEEQLDAPQLYWYDRRSLLELLRRAPDLPSFCRMLMEVFPWRVA